MRAANKKRDLNVGRFKAILTGDSSIVGEGPRKRVVQTSIGLQHSEKVVGQRLSEREIELPSQRERGGVTSAVKGGSGLHSRRQKTKWYPMSDHA